MLTPVATKAAALVDVLLCFVPEEAERVRVLMFAASLLILKLFFVFHAATNWASGEDDHVVARAEYNFSAASEEEISLRAGDMLNLAPKGE